VLGGREVQGHGAEDETLQYECDQDKDRLTIARLVQASALRLTITYLARLGREQTEVKVPAACAQRGSQFR
jgi:hypothetical protein